jgi:Tol biopolymer transport system component
VTAIEKAAPVRLGRFVLYGVIVTVVGTFAWTLSSRLKRERNAAILQVTNGHGRNTQPDLSPDGTRVTFVSDRGGHLNIWTARIDGSLGKNLTRDQGSNEAPAWSPDGIWIAYQATRDGGGPRIFIMNSSGTADRAVSPGIGMRPKWSPDGKQLAYQGKDGIYVLDLAKGSERRFADGSTCREPVWSPDGKSLLYACEMQLFLDAHPITFSTGMGAHAPTWSPDGERIAFTGVIGKSSALFMMKRDGTEVSRLAEIAGNQANPSWSRDGQRIYFDNDGNGNNEVYSLPVPPRTGRRLTNTASDDRDPALAPVGDQLAFTRDRDIFVQDLHTGQLRNLTNNPAADEHAAWSPDGGRIAFDSDRAGPRKIFVMSSDGSDVRAAGNAEAVQPAWSPDGMELAVAAAGQLMIVRVEDGSSGLMAPDHRGAGWPAWSQDGEWIAFSSSHRIFVVPSHGGEVHEVTRGDHPSWKRDGSIGFQCDCGSGVQIFLVRRDGSELRALTASMPVNQSPSFSKDGLRLFFSSNRDGHFGLYEIYN